MNAPQVITIVLMSFSIAAALLLHGKSTKINFFLTTINTAAWAGLLYWGGFFN